jgi:hypothetical protein
MGSHRKLNQKQEMTETGGHPHHPPKNKRWYGSSWVEEGPRITKEVSGDLIYSVQ